MGFSRGLLSAVALCLAIIMSAGLSFAESGKEWTIYGGDYTNTRYSSLDQINKENVKNLKVEWIHSLGSTHSQENTPLVVDGKMYVNTSAGPAYVFALDAKSGKVLWTHQPEMPEDYHSIVCCGHANRGLTYANGKIFMGRLDGVLVALDANTGKELWQVAVMPYKDGFSLTSAPLVVKDIVITGLSGGEYGVRGSLQAYKQETGEPSLEDPHDSVAGLARQRNLEGRVVENRRRYALVRGLLRPRSEPDLLRHQQCRALGRAHAGQRLQ